MIDLSVGQVSAIIAAIITLLQFFLPSALALLIVGVLKDDMSAVSWSSLGATLHSSHLATILRADSTTHVNIQGSMKWLLRLGSVCVLVTFAASIVTPIGLYDTVEPETSLQDVSFPYVADTGPFGFGTPQRSPLGFNRQCGTPSWTVCPGTDTVEVSTGEFTSADFPYGYNSRIPNEKIELFQSGLKEQKQTVSSFFNIQYRCHAKIQDPDVNNGSFYDTGSYRQLGTLVLDNTIEAVEGLVVDMVNGRIAFRNHTVPSGVSLGATWDEELLVMEPETQCGDMKDIVLTDRGGFVNIVQGLPKYDKSAPQINADLPGRAYQAAWFFNVLLGIYYNVTRPNPDVFGYLESELGKTFRLPETTLLRMDELAISTYDDVFSTFLSNDNSTSSFSSTDDFPFWPNPFGITSDNFTDILTECNGVTARGKSNMSAVAVGCGLVYGVPRLANGETKLFYDPGERLSMPLMSCASAVKVSVKNFSFRFNGTSGLESLRVDAIQERSPASPALYWGIENNNDLDLDIQDTSPLWGLVSSDTRETSSLSVIKSPHYYLPGYLGVFTMLTGNGADNVPGLRFPVESLSSLYNGDIFDSSTGVGDYSGKTSFAMFAQWQKLAASTNGTARIANLIFTDLAANALVGTKSWLPPSDAVPGFDGNLQKRQSSSVTQTSVQVPVRVFTRQIKYNWAYGIPAYIAAFLTGLVGMASLILLCVGRTSLSKTKAYLDATSPGRILSYFVYPGECEPRASTSMWARGVGGKKVRIGRPSWVPHASQPLLHPEKASNGAQQWGYGHSPAGIYCYETDADPLIDQKMGTAIQMTPTSSPMPPTQQGFCGAPQDQKYNYQPHQGYEAQFGAAHVAGPVQAQFAPPPTSTPGGGAYTPGGYAR